jgi:hypothetical protein
VVVVAGDEDVGVGDWLTSHDLAFPPVFEFGGWMTGGAGFVSVGEGDWDSGNVEDKVVSASEDGCAAAIPFLIGLQDFGYLLDDCEVVVVGGAGEGFSV